MFGCSDKNTEKDNDKENNNKIKLEYKEYKSSQSFLNKDNCFLICIMIKCNIWRDI